MSYLSTKYYGIETPLKVLVNLLEKIMTQYTDRSTQYMREMWGTTRLVTDPHSLPNENLKKQKMLREINEDEMTPKKHDFKTQNEIHERIRNDDDYDDWYYGTEPIFG